MELDIYIPSIKLAIEYDGEAWHKSDKHEREKKKYQICQKNGIKLIRLREKTSDEDRFIADYVLSIEGDMYKHNQLAKVIRFLLDKIDPESNMWTRKKPIFHSLVDIDLDRDESEIRFYMSKLRTGSLADVSPSITAEWHSTRNINLLPSKVKPHSGIKVWWKCPVCGNEYKASIAKRMDGTGCPKCGIQKSTESKQKQVVMIDPETSAELRVFPSISEASRELGISAGNISMVCKGKRKTAGGFCWAYKSH